MEPRKGARSRVHIPGLSKAAILAGRAGLVSFLFLTGCALFSSSEQNPSPEERQNSSKQTRYISIDPAQHPNLRHIHFFQPAIRFQDPESFFVSSDEEPQPTAHPEKIGSWIKIQKPVDYELLNDRALTLYLEDYTEESLLLFQAVLANHPAHPEIYLNGGRLAVQEKNPVLARSFMKLMADSGHFSEQKILEMAGQNLSRRPEGPLLSVLLIEETLKKNPHRAELHRWLAIRSIEYDRFPSAYAHLASSLKLEPEDPEAHYLLATLLDRKKESAKKAGYYYLSAALAGSKEMFLCNRLSSSLLESYPSYHPAQISIIQRHIEQQGDLFAGRKSRMDLAWVQLMADLSSELPGIGDEDLEQRILVTTEIQNVPQIHLSTEAKRLYSKTAVERMEERNNPADPVITELLRKCLAKTPNRALVQKLGDQILRFDDRADLSFLKGYLPQRVPPSRDSEWEELQRHWYGTAGSSPQEDPFSQFRFPY